MKLKKTTKKDNISLLQSLAVNNPHFSKHKTDSNTITNNIDNNSNSNDISTINNEILITDQKRYPIIIILTIMLTFILTIMLTILLTIMLTILLTIIVLFIANNWIRKGKNKQRELENELK